MIKKLLIVCLLVLIPIISHAQFKIGKISLKDSSGVLVVSVPLNIANSTQGWIKKEWLSSLASTNSGLKWDSVNGLSLKIGTGLTIVNDTLKYNGSTSITVDDSTLHFVNGVLKAKILPNYGITSDAYGLRINLSTNTGLSFNGTTGKLQVNIGQGVTVDGSNNLKLNVDGTTLAFDGSNKVKIADNSITNNQISPDLNLDSIKISGMVFKDNGAGILGFSDSLFAPRIIAYEYVVDGITPVDDATINFKVGSSSEVARIAVNDVGTFYVSVAPSTLIPKSVNIPTYTIFYDSVQFRSKLTVVNNAKASTIYSGMEWRFTDLVYDSLAYNFDNIYGTFYRDLRLQNARLQGYKGTDVASASKLTLGKGNYFSITGTTDVDLINSTGWQEGSIITLYVPTGFTFNHNTAPDGAFLPLSLSSSGNFVAGARSIICFAFDGSYWREISRTTP